jgi:hypothetical protein
VSYTPQPVHRPGRTCRAIDTPAVQVTLPPRPLRYVPLPVPRGRPEETAPCRAVSSFFEPARPARRTGQGPAAQPASPAPAPPPRPARVQPVSPASRSAPPAGQPRQPVSPASRRPRQPRRQGPRATPASQGPLGPAGPRQPRFERRGYATAGSVNTFTNAGRPAANARSSAPRNCSGRSTSSPWPPSACTTVS